MTDEEMAEEYENAQDYCGLLDVLFEEQYNQDYGGLRCYISPYIEQAFLAGLKADRPQWHDLRKDPNDLPKGNIPVLVIIDYLALGKEYAIRENLKEDSKGVIAWCEIPTFDKE